ncbi:MAG: hypothetical protein RLZZ241_2586 [Bacteroidota bacterium]
MYKRRIKRIVDIVAALGVLIVFSPIILVVTLILIYINKGKPFFYQDRPGKNEQIFTLMKFKTMTDEKDENGNLLPNERRVTPFGLFIRKTSIDELPQAFNILKGDMSLIGPRPLLIRYLPYYTEQERIRHSVRPGITGLAQVSGRNTLHWDERLAYDIEYVKGLSLWNDVIILFRTVKKVFKSEDIILDQETIMPDLDDYRRNK